VSGPTGKAGADHPLIGGSHPRRIHPQRPAPAGPCVTDRTATDRFPVATAGRARPAVLPGSLRGWDQWVGWMAGSTRRINGRPDGPRRPPVHRARHGRRGAQGHHDRRLRRRRDPV